MPRVDGIPHLNIQAFGQVTGWGIWQPPFSVTLSSRVALGEIGRKAVYNTAHKTDSPNKSRRNKSPGRIWQNWDIIRQYKVTNDQRSCRGMVEKEGRVPQRKTKEKYALGIITLFPALKDPLSAKGYEKFYDAQSGSGFLAWRLKTIQRKTKLECTKMKMQTAGWSNTGEGAASDCWQVGWRIL